MVVRVGYITVSAKIPRRLKELLDKYGIKPGPSLGELLRRRLRGACYPSSRRRPECCLRGFPT
jgi:hypothetical protein